MWMAAVRLEGQAASGSSGAHEIDVSGSIHARNSKMAITIFLSARIYMHKLLGSKYAFSGC